MSNVRTIRGFSYNSECKKALEDKLNKFVRGKKVLNIEKRVFQGIDKDNQLKEETEYTVFYE